MRSPTWTRRRGGGGHWLLLVGLLAAHATSSFAQGPSAVDGSATELDLESLGIVIHERVELELQQIYVSAEGRGGARVLDLEPGELRLLDEGRPQELVTFERGGVPMTAVLLVDGSLSMEGEPMAAARQGLRSFLQGLEPADEARVVLFTDQIVAMSDFVAGGGEPPAFDHLEAAGGSAVNDHLYFALQLLESRQGRRVVLLLSDGADNHSVLTAEEVREVAQRSQAMVYWVRLRGNPLVSAQTTRNGIATRVMRRVQEPRSAWREGEQAVAERRTLERIVRDSGGRILTLERSDEIAGAYHTILRELREQYALGYYPDPAYDDGRWRTITLEALGRRGLTLRCRGGYFDF